MINRYKEDTNASSKGNDRFQRSAKTTSTALYLFLVALLACAILVVIR
jgi:hypothetical protein